jgi:hypothetical protein
MEIRSARGTIAPEDPQAMIATVQSNRASPACHEQWQRWIRLFDLLITCNLPHQATVPLLMAH